MSILAAPFSKRSLENPNVPITAYQLADIFGGGPTRAGIQVNEKTALSYMAVFSAVKVIAESIGNTPLRVYRRVDADKVMLVTDRPESYMLGLEANDEQTAAFAQETIQAWECLWGNGYARIIKAKSTMQMIPLRSDLVHPERKAGELVFRVEAQDGVGAAGTFFADEIIHLPGLSMNGVTGLSPIGLAREAIAAGKAKEIFDGTFYGNGTNIGGTLTHPGKLKPEVKQAMAESWNARYQGVANANRVAILDEGVKYEGKGMPLRDAEFIESRKFSIIEICRLYRIPPHMLMDLDRSTNNNIEQQSLEFLMYCIGPWMNKWEQELTRKLFGVGSDYFVAFDLTKLLMPDMATQEKFYASGKQWGYLNTNDIRKRIGLNPVDGGDVYLSPQNMVPADKTHALIDSQIAANGKKADAAKDSKADPKADPAAPPKPAENAGPVGLNGAQITAAIDIVTKLRSGSIAPQAAEPLLVSVGIEEGRAQAIVKATKAGAGGAETDRQFMRELLLAFAANPDTTAVVANAVKVTDTAAAAGAPANKEYDEPYLPVSAPPGQAMVTGEVVTDSEGSIVGGAVEKPAAAPKPADPTADPLADPEAPPADGKDAPIEEPKRMLARRLIAAAARRMVRKEVNAIRKAFIGSQSVMGDAGAWSERFYAEHKEHLRAVLCEPAEALAEMCGCAEYVAQDVVAVFAEEAARSLRAGLLDLAGRGVVVLSDGMTTHEEAWPVFTGNALSEKLLRSFEIERKIP